MEALTGCLPVGKRSKALVRGAAQVGGRAAPGNHPIQACAPVYGQTQLAMLHHNNLH